MEITRNGTRPTRRGPSEWFTGDVRMDPLMAADTPGRPAGLHVTFAPGARTNWHTHRLGQTLIITSGLGQVQREGGPIETVAPGDVVWFEPGEKHWHGAAPEVAMSHIAIQAAQDGSTTDWMEPVTDAQYGHDAEKGQG